MKIVKYILGIAAIGAAGSLLAAKSIRDKKRQEELDDFLMGSSDDTLVIDIPHKNEAMLSQMKKDIMSWSNSDIDSSIQMIFSFEDFKDAYAFQDEISKLGLSSSVNDENRTIELFYHGNLNEDALNLLANDLYDLLLDTKINYQHIKVDAQ